MQSNSSQGGNQGEQPRQRRPQKVSTSMSQQWVSHNSLDRLGARSPEEVSFDVQEPTQLDNPIEGTQNFYNNPYHIPQSLDGNNIDPSLVPWQLTQQPSQVPCQTQSHGAKYNLSGPQVHSLPMADGIYVPSDGNTFHNSLSYTHTYPQQIGAYGHSIRGYPSTTNPHSQQQAFRQPFQLQSGLPTETTHAAIAPQALLLTQQLQSFAYPQQHSQVQAVPSGSVQLRAPASRVLPAQVQNSGNRDNITQRLAPQAISEQFRNGIPAPRAANYVHITPNVGSWYRPKQLDDMGNPITWERIATGEEYTSDELRELHEFIEVLSNLHMHL